MKTPLFLLGFALLTLGWGLAVRDSLSDESPWLCGLPAVCAMALVAMLVIRLSW